MGCSLWGQEELDMTEQLSTQVRVHTHTHTHTHKLSSECEVYTHTTYYALPKCFLSCWSELCSKWIHIYLCKKPMN